MNRSILVSGLIIAVAVALLAGAGTQALFTDSQTASGSINAAAPGVTDLRLNDVSLPCGVTNISQDEITFEQIENLVPGDSVTCEIELENQGTEAFDVDVTGADLSASILDTCDGLGDDFSVVVTKGTDTDGDDVLGSTARVAAGATDTAFIEVTFDGGATDDCQGVAAFVSVTFTAVQAP